MSILTRLFGSKNRPPSASDKPPTLRSLLKARTPPWHRVSQIVIDAIFDALDDTELFDCFVRASMESNLLKEYEQLGREDKDISMIRARISGILCQAGFRRLTDLEKHATTRQSDGVKRDGMITTDLFKTSIAMSVDQHAGYLGMAAVYDYFGMNNKSNEIARRGLAQLEKTRQSAAGRAMRESTVFPPDMHERLERQLRSFVTDSDAHKNRGASVLQPHVPDDKTRLGRRGICMLCGTIKSGSVIACRECGFQPISVQEVAIALILNEASMRNFEQVAGAIKSGVHPEYKEDDIQKFTEGAAENRRMTGLDSGRYRVRAQTESLLASSGQVVLQGMSHAIAKLESTELSEVSEERTLAVFAKMIKAALLRRAPGDEKEFIERFFQKRLLLTSLRYRLPRLSGISVEEVVHRTEQAFADLDAIGFDVDAGRYDLERAVISFVLPRFDPARSYMKEYRADPYIGMYVRTFVDTFAKVVGDKATDWD
jgi:hypothetical protein